MKKYIFLLLLLPVWVSAQNQLVVEATAGADIAKMVSEQMQYLLPEFTNGDVYYLGSSKGSGQLNYNMILGEMQFMENGQVMSLANVKNVVLVNIGNRRFYRFNDKEFAEELLSTGAVQLRVRHRATVAPHSKKGAYGMESSTSAITSYSSINEGGRQYNLNVAESMLVSMKSYYYLVRTNGKYTMIKNTKTFTKLFPAYRTQIEVFVKKRNTRFDKEEDLIALLEYCSKLNN